MAIPSRLRKLIPAAAAGAAFTLATPPAFAFFPPIPVGSDPVTVIPQPPAPIIPVSPTIPVIPVEVPPVPPPPFVPPPPVIVERPVEKPDCPTPQVVPEPATIVSSALGLTAIGGYVWRRRKQKQ